jgi:hypothetical protein
MSSVKKQRRRTPKIQKIKLPGSPAGLAKSRKIIRAQKDLEIQFMKLCSPIRLDDFKNARSEKQKDERQTKRKSA